MNTAGDPEARGPTADPSVEGSGDDGGPAVPDAPLPATVPDVAVPDVAVPDVAALDVAAVDVGVPESGSWDLDLAAASLRIDTADTDAMFESLGAKLERILGGRVQVTREGGLRRKTKRVAKIVVDAGGTRLEAARSRVGPSFSEAHAVRGITLRTHEISADEWLERLVALVRAEAAGSSDVRGALGRILE